SLGSGHGQSLLRLRRIWRRAEWLELSCPLLLDVLHRHGKRGADVCQLDETVRISRLERVDLAARADHRRGDKPADQADDEAEETKEEKDSEGRAAFGTAAEDEPEDPRHRPCDQPDDGNPLAERRG